MAHRPDGADAAEQAAGNNKRRVWSSCSIQIFVGWTTGTHIRGIVSARWDLTPELWIVRIRPESTVLFVPGQYVSLGIVVGSRLIERPYSIASDPTDPELEFFIEVVPGGKLTPHLHQTSVGGEVWLRPLPKGRFLFDRESGRRNHFMAATVTGVAPFVSMLRCLVRQPDNEVPYRIALLEAASFAGELGYREWLTDAAKSHEWFDYVPTISRAWLDPDWPGERGRIEDVARKYLDHLKFDVSSTTVYLCGNPDMIRTMKGVLERTGFDKTQIKEEVYWPAARSST